MSDDSRRPILFITVDSLRADHVGWHGYERDTTPFLDDLAAEARVFPNAFSHAGRTPNSFPAILSSTYATMYGGGEALSPSTPLVSEVLDGAGYSTAGFHSNPYLTEKYGYERGYDHYFDSIEENSGTARVRQFVKDRFDSDGVVYQSLYRAFKIAEGWAGVEVGSPFVDAATLTDKAVEWIDETPEPPQYLWVHYMDVHHPYVAPDEYQYEFREDPIGKRRSVQLRRKMLEEPDAITDEELQTITDIYDAEIRHTDTEIERLVGAATEAWNDVVTIFTADHGEELGDHGHFSHHIPKFMDEHIHVPLLVHDGAGHDEYDEIVGLLDLPPTIVEYAGEDPPDEFLGTSLHRLYEGDWDRRSVIAEWQNDETGDRNVAVRSDDWCYVYRDNRRRNTDYPEGEPQELYDLQADPDQQHNVLDEHPEVVERLHAEVERHVEFVESTDEEVEAVETTAEIEQRLEDLGYKT